ncbi:gliding motility-associated protein GldE [Pontibacter arcticus]|uniref:gliding motility-associated protein GldE n=1 Tax=Pontibacter arcticus TaxID=2080288 RepID=UPI001EF0B0CD|nr:gliding motility-associated protein GldE [Pontibacter arcticus]
MAALAGGLFLLLLSALVSGAEAAFFSVTDQQKEALQQSPGKREKILAQLLQNPRRLLLNFLVIRNSIRISIIILAVYLTSLLFGSYDFSLGIIEATGLLVVFLLLFFGEVLPRAYAHKNPLKYALRFARFIRVLAIITNPPASLLLRLNSFITGRYMVRGYNHTIQHLHHSLDIALSNEDSSPEERKLLRGVVNFGSISVRQIMRPRVDIVAFNTAMRLPELVPEIMKWGYSRIPVYSESTDKIEGILYIKDLLPYLNEAPDFNWQQLIRAPFFVPDTRRIADLFQDFKEKHVHMAIVLSEYGTTTGLLTLEDIIEEIVGEINDEFDDDDGLNYSQLDENTFIFDGKTSLHDFCKIVELPFDAFNEVKGEHETVAGLILSLFSRIPRVGEEISFGRYHFTVESADLKRVKRIKINVSSKKEQYQKVS